MFRKIKEKRIKRKVKEQMYKDQVTANIKAELEEQSNEDKCFNLLKLYDLSNEQSINLKLQISSIIEELESIGHPINHQEIVDEVIEQNELENLKKSGSVEELNLKYASRNLKFNEELISRLVLNGKYSSCSIDLREFQFNAGELLIEMNSKYSGIDIYINDSTNVADWTAVNMAGISYHLGNDLIQFHDYLELPIVSKVNSLRLEGKNYLSGVRIIVNYEGPVLNLNEGSKRTKKRMERASKRLEKRK